MIKSLVILIAELNENINDFLMDFFLKLGMGIGVFIGGLAGGLVYLTVIGFEIAIVGFGIWLIYKILSPIYEFLGRPGETVLPKVYERFEEVITFGGWLLMMIAIVVIASWLI